MTESIPCDDLLGDFLDEADGLLRQLNEDLLLLDGLVATLGGPGGGCDLNLLNSMFRAAHSLKGLSGMFGLNEINALVHKVENVFDAARQDRLRLTRDVVDLVFKSVDQLSGMIDDLRHGKQEAGDSSRILEAIQELLARQGLGIAHGSQGDVNQALAALNSPKAEANPAISVAPAPPATVAQVDDELSDVHDEGAIAERYLQMFIDETDVGLQELTATLLADDAGQRAAELLIVCHRVKGSAASIGLGRTARLAHRMEDLLQALCDERRGLERPHVDALLGCVDTLRAVLDALRRGERYADLARLQTDLASLRAARHVSEPQGTATSASTTSTAASGPRELAGHVVFEPGLALVELKARLLYEKLAQLGRVTHSDPPEEALDDATTLERWEFTVDTAESVESLRRHLQVAGVREVVVRLAEKVAEAPQSAPATELPPATTATPAAAPASSAASAGPAVAPTVVATAKPSPPGKEPSADAKSKPPETLRVDTERLDHLMNLAGQLVINRARFSRVCDELRGISSSKQVLPALESALRTLDRLAGQVDETPGALREALDAHARQIRHDLETIQRDARVWLQMRGLVNDLSEAVHQLGRVSDGIQQSVMDTRMVPIGPLFERFRRVVRDITARNGKDIRLVIRGEKTELDKRMIDELGDPLVHLVRNSCDHGIESPEDRIAAGKPAQGSVELEAYHCGNRIVVEVRDDGRGLDLERIKRKAISRGIVTEQAAEKLTPQQTHQLIWEPGFSTAEQVTEVSGRGMGMDIVRAKVEGLSGTVELTSTQGKGATFTIKLPLTLAILPSLLAEHAGDVFAIPVESVVEIVRVEANTCATVHGVTTARIRDRVISVVDLAEAFVWRRPPRVASDATDAPRIMVIAAANGHEIGILVDRVLGEEDVVIKSLADNYRNVTGIAGASIFGNGRVSLILDLGAVVDMCCQERREAHGARPVARHESSGVAAPVLAGGAP